MNIFDKTLSVVAPGMALKRTVARKQLEIINSGYSNHGASTSKKSLLGWRSKGGSPKEDIIDNLKMLRERSRDLYMGAPIATSAIKTSRTNVIGGGLRLKSEIDGEILGLDEDECMKLEEKIEREFALWADTRNCDLERLNNFYELQQLAFLSWLMNGDAFALMPKIKRPGEVYDLRILLIEADRICNDNNASNTEKLQEGVEINDIGEIVAYHICSRHPLSTSFNGAPTWTRVEAFGAVTGRPNVLHLMESERIGQKRGVPVLAPVIEALKQLGRYTEAELMAAVISGMYTVFIESKSNEQEPSLGEAIPIEEQIDTEDENSYELGNGAIIALGEGESIKEANPGRPNTAFDGFVNSICRQIGAALEIPTELLLKQFTASYSASRGALLEAWKMFKMKRQWMADDFCQPIFEEWMFEAVAKERISAPGFFNDPLIRKAYCGSKWNGPSSGQIDPLKEINAAAKRIEEGISTRSKETVELTGGDFYKNCKQRLREEKAMKEVRSINGEDQPTQQDTNNQ